MLASPLYTTSSCVRHRCPSVSTPSVCVWLLSSAILETLTLLFVRVDRPVVTISRMVLMEGESVAEDMLCVWGDMTHVQVVRDGLRSQVPQYAVSAAAIGQSAPCTHWCCRQEKDRRQKAEGLIINSKERRVIWLYKHRLPVQTYLQSLKYAYHLISSTMMLKHISCRCTTQFCM